MICSGLKRARGSRFLLCLSAFLLCIAFKGQQASAQGNLLVTPRRVVFENATRVQELNLANTGTDSARYLVSVVEIRMHEDGTFEQIREPDSGQLFASRYLRIYPRSVIIAPGESQLVKIQLVRTEGLAPGEYRSHVYIRAVPFEKPLGDQPAQRDSNEISVKLTPIFGISIPALLRVGENDTRITLSDPTLEFTEGKPPRLGVTLNRTGLMSSYGDFTVELESEAGKTREVGSVMGVAVYTPNVKRRFYINLDASNGINYKSGKLRIAYKTQKDSKIQDGSTAELILK